MNSHFIRYYSCALHVEAQCRCPGSKIVSVGTTTCPKCDQKVPDEFELLAQTLDLMRSKHYHTCPDCGALHEKRNVKREVDNASGESEGETLDGNDCAE